MTAPPAVLTSSLLRRAAAVAEASIAIVATPRAALWSAARNTSKLERPKPWPKITTGQPPAGGAPDGTISAKPIRAEPAGAGVRRVGVARIVWCRRAHCGAASEPNA